MHRRGRQPDDPRDARRTELAGPTQLLNTTLELG